MRYNFTFYCIEISYTVKFCEMRTAIKPISVGKDFVWKTTNGKTHKISLLPKNGKVI